MTTRVHAVYRGGVFLPASPVPVGEGAEVELTVTVNGQGSLADALEQSARLPQEDPTNGFRPTDAALDNVYELLRRRHASGEHDVAQRHDQHQP